ncbi:PadR family transcriptional regulator [Komagataeibacter nataicola]|uniref:PadR family transcriptional regulator n=1 Tax=Komagataeibacter nataicola TaxID=265960 RepID=UPI0028A59962|nr:PadR family transcriptional regulator [Komagataeibacter nataicola]WNM09873.1 PadR family transcriptional regulator [Komagataeibacter nataicola]
MKHANRHAGGRHRHVFSPEGLAQGAGRHGGRGEGRENREGREGREGRGHHGRGGHRGGPRNRLFDYGEMRLLVLSLIAEKPTYGYELIKTIEEKSGGSYTPSPGVIYPTLTWLDEAGYIRPGAEESRKNYHITPEGEAFVAANRAGLEAILARAATAGPQGRGGGRNVPVPVMRAMENLKTALRLRLRNGGLDPQAEEKIAALLDETARALGQA